MPSSHAIAVYHDTTQPHHRPETSGQALQLLAAFGVGRLAKMELPTVTLIDHQTYPAGSVILLTGPSGSGKTTLLPTLIECFEDCQVAAVGRPDPQTPIIDTLGPVPTDAAAMLCSVGLTDAACWARTYPELSTGQKIRYDVAALLHWTTGVIVIDDWLDHLDRITAQAAAWTIGKALRRKGRSAILATPHEDLVDHLCPTHQIRVSIEGTARHQDAPLPPAASPLLDEIKVRVGTLADYAPLSPLHYAAGPPQSPRAVWVAEHPDHPRPIGVVVVTYPDLRNPARDLVTEDRYKSVHQREAAKRLNREVGRIARIVVDPRWRGIGITRLLIDAAATWDSLMWLECSSAMAWYTPFLDRLGFVEAPRPSHDIEAKLLDWAERNQLQPQAAYDPEELGSEMERLSVRERRQGRRLIWQYYHKHVLHRRTKAALPKQVPNASDDRWLQAFEFVARRLFERPRYMILGPLTPSQESPR